MIVYFLLLMALVLVGTRVRRQSAMPAGSSPSPAVGGSEDDFLGRNQALVVNGFFILEVFLCHAKESMLGPLGYAMSGWGDQAWLTVFCKVFSGRQVVLFLFFSGYGVCEQLRLRGEDYLRAIPRRRMLTTYLNYAIAVGVFILANLALRTDMTGWDALLALGFLRSIGNSTWYIACIILMYFFTYVANRVFRKRLPVLLTIAGLTMVYIAVTAAFASSYWYDTALAYPLGVAVSLYKPEVMAFLRRRTLWAWLAVGGLLALTLPLAAEYPAVINNLAGLAFVGVVVLFLRSFRVESRPLAWAGAHLFPIYIYQKLFFLMVAELYSGPVTPLSMHLALVVTLLATLLTARFYRSVNI